MAKWDAYNAKVAKGRKGGNVAEMKSREST